MEFPELFGLFGILRESLKILNKNRKIIGIVAAIHISVCSLIFIIFTFSTKDVIQDLLGKQTVSLLTKFGTPDFAITLVETRNDLAFIFTMEFVRNLVSVFIVLYSVSSIILISAATYCGKSLSFSQLVSRMAKSFQKQLVTSFYITVFGIGFIIFLLVILCPFILLGFDHLKVLHGTLIVLSVLALIVIAYLSIVWTLAMVMTVIEENCYGLEALGKAATLVKGKKIQGFALHLLFMLASSITLVITMKRVNKSFTERVLIWIFMICLNFVIVLFQYMSYTVLYFQCKKNHGEEVELQGDYAYSEVALGSEEFP